MVRPGERIRVHYNNARLPKASIIHPGTPRWSTRAIVAAVGTAACLMYLAGAAHGVGTAELDYAFSPSDPPPSQHRMPALDVPLGAPATVSVLAANGAMAVAKGRRSAPRDLAAVAAAATVAAFAGGLIAVGLPAFPVALGAIAMSASTLSWQRGVSWTNDALSPLLAIVAIWALWRWSERRQRTDAIVALVAGVLAMAEDAAWLAVIPGVCVFLTYRVASRRERLQTIGIVVVALVLATALAMRPIATADTAAAIGADTSADAWLWWRPALARAESWSPLRFGTDLSRELTPLGLALAAIGAVVVWRSGRHRPATIVTAMGLFAWHSLAPQGHPAGISVPMALSAWAAVVLALCWLHSLPRRGAVALVTVVGVLLAAEPSLARMRFAALGRDTLSEARQRMAYDFPIDHLPRNTALVAESRRVDATLLTLSRRSGHPLPVVPQHADAVLTASASGPVIAFDGARANLERFGFLFERGWLQTTPVAILTGHVPCVTLQPGEWHAVSRLAAAGSLIVHGIPPAGPGGVVLKIAAPEPVTVQRVEPGRTPFEITEGTRDNGTAGMAELERAASMFAFDAVTTIRLPETDHVGPATVTFTGVPPAIVATGEGSAAARLCSGVHRSPLTLGRASGNAVVLQMASPEPFGVGWHPLEADPDYFRWTGAPHVSVRITMAQPSPVRVTITATPAAQPAQRPEIGLVVNNCQLPSQPMSAGQGDYEWTVNQECWLAGANLVWLGTGPLVSPAGSHDTRLLGARIGAIRLRQLPLDQSTP